MISNATKRTILRTFHLILSIPILGYVYNPFCRTSKLRPRSPVCLRSYPCPFGILDVCRRIFAIIGVAVWLGAIYLSGIGAAILS